MTKEEFEAALEKYVAGVTKMYLEWCGTIYPNAQINLEHRTRYIKVVTNNGHSSSVHSFIDTTNGDILKGSWKAPVKNGVRGNILAENNGLDKVNWHGPKYLRN